MSEASSPADGLELTLTLQFDSQRTFMPALDGRTPWHLPEKRSTARPNSRCDDDTSFPTLHLSSKIRVLRPLIEPTQYCSHDYQKRLRQHGFVVSMSGKGNCYDNAAVDTFFKTVKAELIWRHRWQTRRQAEMALFEYINGFYNPRRRHSALGGKSPIAFEQKAA